MRGSGKEEERIRRMRIGTREEDERRGDKGRKKRGAKTMSRGTGEETMRRGRRG